MRAVVVGLVALGVAIASPVSAGTIHGLVYDDINGDGAPSAGEPGIANAVVAFGVKQFVVTDASGQFDISTGIATQGIVWARVPDGFKPGPAWSRWDGMGDVDIALHRLSAPVHGPLTFVVASDTHIAYTQEFFGEADLANVASNVAAMDPAPAFFTILGDVTQGSREPEYVLVDRALEQLDVPWIPVPGNHDWYDYGAAWFKHYGPDNYSFDIAGVHFIVWNMAMTETEIATYLGAELERVPATMPIVALTHEPPKPAVIAVLRNLGVDYVLTGHTHSNRAVDHGGLIELGTQPLLMGAMDFTPAGYRVVTIEGGHLLSTHHTVVEAPFFALVAPRTGDCTPAQGGELLAAAEVATGASAVTARIDCATPFQLRRVGNWLWRGDLPPLSSGDHLLELEVTAPNQPTTQLTKVVTVCSPPLIAALYSGEWSQVGGSGEHTGSVGHEIVPPLQSRWVTPLGNHVLTSPPVVAGRTVYVATTDLADGNTGGIAAMELTSGAIRWRVSTAKPIRGGLAVVDGTVITTQIDGEVLALDAATGAMRWERAMSSNIDPQAGAVFSPPAAAANTVFLGHQRAVAALDVATGAPRWIKDPVPAGFNSQTNAAVAVGHGLALGTFHRELGGVIAWDVETGEERWRYAAGETVAINASPVIGPELIYLVSGATEVTALDFTGTVRWRAKVDAQGFDWGYASVGTPALAGTALIVPTLYGSLVALDAQTGKERWRYRARPGPLRGTHYRGKGQPAFAASPVVTGELVWAADTSGLLSALDIRTGLVVWYTELPSPVMSGLAVSGDWLFVASFDGTLRALTPGVTLPERTPSPDLCRVETPPVDAGAGCCNTGSRSGSSNLIAILLCCLLLRRRT